MNKDKDGKTNQFLEFTVRNDKFRGLVIEKFVNVNNECFFKHRDQPIQRHCQEIQTIVQSANVKQAKVIRIDVAKFYYEYFFRLQPTFRGCPMTTTHGQMDKVCALNISKEIGAIKRNVTIAQNKSKKIEERNFKISTNMQLVEQKFQTERAKRLNELYGGVNPQTPHSSAVPSTSQIPVACVHPQTPELIQEVQDAAWMDQDLPDNDSDL